MPFFLRAFSQWGDTDPVSIKSLYLEISHVFFSLLAAVKTDFMRFMKDIEANNGVIAESARA